MALLMPNSDSNPMIQALQQEAHSASQQLNNLVSLRILKCICS